jgi:hypothetical protein
MNAERKSAPPGTARRTLAKEKILTEGENKPDLKFEGWYGNCTIFFMKKSKTKKEIKEAKANRASFHHGSTTQAGPDFGQGSSQLGNTSFKQGSESKKGMEGNESGLNEEGFRRKEE